MMKNMTLSRKLILGFSPLVIITGALGYVGWSVLRTVTKTSDMANGVSQVYATSLQGRIHEKNYMLRKDPQELVKADQVVQTITDMARSMGGSSRDQEDREAFDALIAQSAAWIQAVKAYASAEEQKDRADARMVTAAREAIKQVKGMRDSQRSKLLAACKKQDSKDASSNALNEINERIAKVDDAVRLGEMILEARRDEKNFIIRGDPNYRDNAFKTVSGMVTLTEGLRRQFKDEANIKQADAMLAAIQEYRTAFGDYVAQLAAQTSQTDAMVAAARSLQEKTKLLATAQEKKLEAAASFATRLMVSLALGGIILGVALALLIARGISKPIHQIVLNLTQGSTLVAEASDQVNASAGSLAEAASEQASSLEETSAAIEQMTAMTSTTAENAHQANGLVTQVQDAAERSNKEMDRLNVAMTAINDSSTQISRIIKVIEEIAFQTNLLALNAAVEAARAGEHGKGFAVVADEVRNLAQRAAQAARETTSLIETSVDRAREGTEVTSGFGTAMSQIAQNVTAASRFVGQITEASAQQKTGLGQINEAVQQIDKATQSIAATSEESAAAVEELSAQAGAVAQTAEDLGALIGVRLEQQDRGKAAQEIKQNIQERRLAIRSRGGK